MAARFFAFIILVCTLQLHVQAQIITGEAIDKDTKQPINHVNIENVYNNLAIYTDSAGKFIIEANKGQLLIFRKMGYTTVRVRIPDGFIPPYFKIIMKKGPIQLEEYTASAHKYDYYSDSIRFHDIYQHELDFPKMSGLDMIEHPFSAISKTNQEIWSFQKQYEYTQRQKYVDYTFNPDLIKKLTGLEGDSAQNYIRRYRPSYEQLRSMSEYNLYNYIKFTVHQFRKFGYSPSRNQQ